MMGRDKNEMRDGPRRPVLHSQSLTVSDWEGVNEKLLVHAIGIVSRKGGALRLGYTRDGGAYAIGVYAGANYWTDYLRPTDDPEEYLQSLIESFEEYDPKDAGSQAPTRAKKA